MKLIVAGDPGRAGLFLCMDDSAQQLKTSSTGTSTQLSRDTRILPKT